MLTDLGRWRWAAVQWAFWRSRTAAPQRALPDDVGLLTATRPPAAPDRDDDVDDPRPAGQPGVRTSGASPTTDPAPSEPIPLPAPAPDVDRAALVAAGPAVAAAVLAPASGAPAAPDARTFAIAATGALAGRLPALSGADDAAATGEAEDDLLHAFAELLANRAHARAGGALDDLLAVVHLAAAAAAAGAASEPALLLLADAPADRQVRAAVVLLQQTAADGGAAPDRLAAEVRELFGPSG